MPDRLPCSIPRILASPDATFLRSHPRTRRVPGRNLLSVLHSPVSIPLWHRFIGTASHVVHVHVVCDASYSPSFIITFANSSKEIFPSPLRTTRTHAHTRSTRTPAPPYGSCDVRPEGVGCPGAGRSRPRGRGLRRRVSRRQRIRRCLRKAERTLPHSHAGLATARSPRESAT